MAKRTSNHKTLHLKLRGGCRAKEKDAVVGAARSAGAVDVRPLFPESEDAELASFYTIDVPSAKARRVIQQLETLKTVEFVEEEVKRGLRSS